jgi:hypothetical protein
MDGYHRNNRKNGRYGYALARDESDSPLFGQGKKEKTSPNSIESPKERNLLKSSQDSNSSPPPHLNRGASPSPPFSRPSSADLHKPREQSLTEHFDHRYIILKTGQLNEEEVHKLIKSLIVAAGKAVGHVLQPHFEMNVVRNSKLQGFDSYLKNTIVFFSDPTAANIIVGCNPDGTERVVEQIIAAAPVPEPAPIVLNFDNPDPFGGRSWADIADEEEALKPIVKIVPLEPLIKLPFVPYVGKALDWNLAQPTKYTGIQITAKRCFVLDPAEGFARHVLCYTADCPPHITEEDIQKQFRPFATDALTEVEFHIQSEKRKFWSKYPMVRFKKEWNEKLKKNVNHIYVYFDRNTRDAAFALKMRKHFVVKGCHLAFSHALTEKTY